MHQSVDTLSKGYRHRTCFAQSILHDPDVLILDEPTDGLDPNQKHEVRELIQRMGEKKAIVFSTHILEEVEAACTRVDHHRPRPDRGQRHAGRAQGARRKPPARCGWPCAAGSADEVAAAAGAVAGAGARREARGGRPGTRLCAIYPEDPRRQRRARVQRSPSSRARRAGRSRNSHTEEGRLDEVFRAITCPTRCGTAAAKDDPD